MLFKFKLRETSKAFSSVILSQILVCSCAHISPLACLMGPQTIHIFLKTHLVIKVLKEKYLIT